MIKKKLIKNSKKIDKFLIRFLKNQKQSLLIKPMKYGVISGGKKIRSTLIMDTGKIFNIGEKKLINICAAVECIHSYSLIHDDLPSMDNDDYRRGKLSTHKKFSESTAILAGDALHDLAFELISGHIKNKKKIIDLINYLSLCIGHNGLALGQSLDLEFENKKISKNRILSMYFNKTGKLFEYSFCAPFILANSSKTKINFAKDFGVLFGLIFQVIDDLIDEIGTLNSIGKTPGKDLKQGKSTLLSHLGKDGVINFCFERIIEFKKKYKRLNIENPILGELLEYGIHRAR